MSRLGLSPSKPVHYYTGGGTAFVGLLFSSPSTLKIETKI